MIDILRLSISVSMYLFRSNKFGLNIYLLTSSYLPTAATITHTVLNNSVNIRISLRSNDYCYEPSSMIYSQRLQSLKQVLVVMMHHSAA